MPLRVAPFDGTAVAWDRFVRDAGDWTHFHLLGWKHVIEDVFGHECPYLAAYDEAGAIAGVLPLVRVKSRLFGHYLVSMPFLNYGGPLGSEEAVKTLTSSAVERARADRVKLLELRSRTPLPVDLPVSHRKITVLLDLPDEDPDVLWKSFKAKLRSQIRRPEKAGVTTRFGPDQVEPFFDVFSQHMRDLGTPTQPLALFRAISERFPDDAWFGCAYLANEPVACGCGFRWADEFEMTWASSLQQHNRIAPNMLLYWKFMERAITDGVDIFNFGRCTPDGGTHRFKRQWGSRDAQLFWYDFSKSGAASTPSPDGGAFSWGPRVWSRLPLSLTNFLGPRVVKFIP